MHIELSRRKFLALSSSGLLIPKTSFASTNERNFVFIFCTGGWDQCYLFAPLFDSDLIAMEDDAEPAEVNGITFVHSPNRPAYAEFLQRYGNITCLINGFESRSVAHDICLRLVSTGSSLPNTDDWPAIIASRSAASPIMPMVSISGPSYTHKYDSAVVRVGSAGQLGELLNRNALYNSDSEITPPSLYIEGLEDAWAQDIATQRLNSAFRGRAEQILQQNLDTNDRLQRLQEIQNDLNISETNDLRESLSLAISILKAGTSRSIMIGYNGLQSMGWDTHAANFLQGIHIQDMFTELRSFMDTLSGTTANNGLSLSNNTTIVLLSEMGRFPQINARGGKDHWTFTSAMLIGSGIRGGQTIGGYNDYCFGKKVDTQSGELSENGEDLIPAHIGSTLLSLADIDHSEFIHDASPITAALL